MNKNEALFNLSLVALFILGVSQAVSYWITNLAADLQLELLEISVARNPGLVFGLQLGDPWDWIVPILVLIWVFLTFRSWWPIGGKWLIVAAGMVIGGGLSNIGERIISGSVQDYFAFLDFPAFNMADILLVTGLLIWIIIALFFFDEEEVARE